MAKQQKQQIIGNKNIIVALYLISILCGAGLMGLEIIGGRILSPFFGTSVYVWGSIISVFLIALSAGYYFGGLLADKKPSLNYLAGLAAIAGLLILIIPPAVEPMSQATLNAGLSIYGALVVAVGLFFLPSLALGMVSPYVVKLGVIETQRLGNQVGKFYSVSTFGSILGTLATTFVLIPVFGVREILYALGVMLVLVAVATFVYSRVYMRSLIIVVVAIAVGWSSWLYSPMESYLAEGSEILYKKETLYNNLAVVDSGVNRYLLFNSTQQTGMNKTRPNEHFWPYTKVMEAAADHYRPGAKDWLLIGLGGGTIPKSLLAQDRQMSFDGVEIDQEVINAAHEYFGLPKNPRINLAATDGRMFVQRHKGKYDVIMVDAYNLLSIPAHLTTREFFQELQEALKPGGVVVFNVVSSLEGPKSQFFKSLMKTAAEVFPQRKIFRAENQPETVVDNLILVASKAPLDSPGELAGAPEYTGTVDTTASQVLTDDYAPVESLAAEMMADF